MDDSASVLVKAFNRNCDRVFSSIVVGGVCLGFMWNYVLLIKAIVYFQAIRLSAFSVIIANKRYSSLSGDYEIVVVTESRLDVLHHEPAVAVRPSFDFRSVEEFQALAIDGLYGDLAICEAFVTSLLRWSSDAIGVIKSISPLSSVHERRSGKELAVMRLLFADSTGSIAVCLWNEMVSVPR